MAEIATASHPPTSRYASRYRG
ncbi:unnamed protein product, partial [Diplocarpon coronariae]